MNKEEYKYYILQELWVARLEKEKSNLEEKEFYKDGKWEYDAKLNLRLNDCIMDFGDYSCLDYRTVSEEEAMEFIQKKNCR